MPAAKVTGEGGLRAGLSPSGRLYLERSAEAPPLPEGFEQKLEAAFARSPGQGLLELGAAEAGAELPADLAFFRDLGRRYLSELCALPDLEELRHEASVPPPGGALAELLLAAPAMPGAEYLSEGRLASLWAELEAAYRAEIGAHPGSVQGFLEARSPLWTMVGRVCFHLAENRQNPGAPFAFLATYATRIAGRAGEARVQHAPLGKALSAYAGKGQKSALLGLLLPVQRAAEKSPLVKELVDSGELFHPLAWTPREAHAFLQQIPAIEASGVRLRLPDWWKNKSPPRPRVSVSVGSKKPSGLGADALLDFSVALTLDGEPLSEDEKQQLLESSEGLTLIKGRWVEVDLERLRQVLDHWKKVERAASEGGVSFLEGMRMLSGLRGEGNEAPGDEGAGSDAARVVAGDWLRKTLEGLRSPEGLSAVHPGARLRATLRPYQEVGVRWLWLLSSLGLGACLADDMGLGKTIQVLSLLLLRTEKAPGERHLLVVPASLLGNWRAEAARFAPELRLLVVHPSVTKGGAKIPAAERERAQVVLTTYGALQRAAWLGEADWGIVVLDEAQAIKNPAVKQTRAVKALKSRVRLALTGTPIENRLGDLWSLFDFLSPGLLGSAQAFGSLEKQMARGGPGAYAPLRSLIRPYLLRRLKTDRQVISDLPDKTELEAFCLLTREQAALYEQSVAALKQTLETVESERRRGAILAFLTRFKQICNHPSQWLGTGDYAPEKSGKFARLTEIAEPIAQRQEKMLVFTQFREMTSPLARHLEKAFGRPGLLLHGGTPVKKRAELVESFAQDRGPPFFVLSLKAGGTGLNLTAASHVVHFDRWWNPAVEEQATDRAFRIGQKRNVLVHKFVCRGTLEERISALLQRKQGLSREMLSGGDELSLTELGDEELVRLVSLDLHSALEEG